jgi:hypothetical protein
MQPRTPAPTPIEALEARAQLARGIPPAGPVPRTHCRICGSRLPVECRESGRCHSCQTDELRWDLQAGNWD